MKDIEEMNEEDEIKEAKNIINEKEEKCPVCGYEYCYAKISRIAKDIKVMAEKYFSIRLQILMRSIRQKPSRRRLNIANHKHES